MFTDYKSITDRDILSFVIIYTPVVTGSFFITKTYINSQKGACNVERVIFGFVLIMFIFDVDIPVKKDMTN